MADYFTKTDDAPLLSLEDFLRPTTEYRPVAFWSWNERLKAEEICRQIRCFAENGFGGVFIHSRIGLITPYLSEDWFANVDAAIEEAKRQGIKIWLYDEDKWPSGYGGGKVPLSNPRNRMKVLFGRPIGAKVLDGAEPVGKCKFGIQVYAYTMPLGYCWFNGTSYIDTMNSKAVDEFINYGYNSYFERFAKHYGQTIVAEFTDEPSPIFRGDLPFGSVPYSETLCDTFMELHGYNPVDKYYLLFVDDTQSESFRIEYFRTLNYLFENSYSKKIGQWCNTKGIAFTGHYMCEHSMYAQQVWGTKVMPNYRHQAIPGIDHLGKTVKEFIAAKQCHSVVNQYGKKRMLSELFGACGNSMSFADRVWIGTQQICLGVNAMVFHLSLYTMSGCRKRDFPPNLFYQQPWWDLEHILITPFSRLCYALSRGKYVSEILVLHPQESAFALWRSKTKNNKNSELAGQNLEWDWMPVDEDVHETLEILDSHLKSILHKLLENQFTFDLGDETIISEDGVITNQGCTCLKIGDAAYSCVILPSMITISQSVFKLLKKFSSAGGHLLLCGNPPLLLDGRESDELNNWFDTIPKVSLNGMTNEINNLVVAPISIEGDDNGKLWHSVRDLENGDRLVFIANLDRIKTHCCKIHFAGSYHSINLLDHWSGISRRVVHKSSGNGIGVDVSFTPTQSYLFELKKTREYTATEPVLMSRREIRRQTISLSHTEYNLLDDNVLVLDYAYWQEADGQWPSTSLPIIAIQERLNLIEYKGPLRLRYEFSFECSKSRNIRLVVEYSERYDIYVNGIIVKYNGLGMWKDINWYQIDIGDLLKPGQNIIELHCHNFVYANSTSISDYEARYGTEIEAVYIIGNFKVSGQFEYKNMLCPEWSMEGLPPVKTIQLKNNNIKLIDQGSICCADTVSQGMPFYAGRLKLRIKLPQLDLDADEKAYIRFTQFDAAIAQVCSSSKCIGYIISCHSEVDITELAGKENEIEIIVYGNLRNLLGPHHHPNGELLNVAPPHFKPVFDNPQNIIQCINDWAVGKVCKGWKNDYCLVSFGDLGELEIVIRDKNSMSFV